MTSIEGKRVYLDIVQKSLSQHTRALYGPISQFLLDHSNNVYELYVFFTDCKRLVIMKIVFMHQIFFFFSFTFHEL